MGQSVEQRRRHLGVAEHAGPLAECQVGGDHDRGLLVEAADQVEQQLDAWLQTVKPAPRVDGASRLDGYLTAIVIGPCSIPPDEWFAHLLGEHGRIATASGAVLAAITTIVARFNAISEGLSLAPSKHAPLFEKTDDGLTLPHPWCMGFLSAMRLRFDDWRPLLDLSRIDHGLLLPILRKRCGGDRSDLS